MKLIPLTKGKVTMVDDADFEMLSQFKWHARPSRLRFYAARSVSVNGKKKFIGMHNFIMGVERGTDHKDNNALNNQRENLRPCDNVTNGQNRKVQTHSSRFKGVHFFKETKRWQVHIQVAKKRHYLGYFGTEEDAGRAYDDAALKFFGEFARTNQMEGRFEV